MSRLHGAGGVGTGDALPVRQLRRVGTWTLGLAGIYLWLPWIIGVERTVIWNHTDPPNTLWFQVCTPSACTDTRTRTQTTGATPRTFELKIRFALGKQDVRVFSCNLGGCSEPSVVPVDVRPNWDPKVLFGGLWDPAPMVVPRARRRMEPAPWSGL